jgi:hypothetical protein
MRNNSLDTDSPAFGKRFGQLIRQLCRKIAKQISDIESHSAYLRLATGDLEQEMLLPRS